MNRPAIVAINPALDFFLRTGGLLPPLPVSGRSYFESRAVPDRRADPISTMLAASPTDPW